VFRRILGPKEGITRGSTQLIKEALHNRYSSLNVVGMITSKRFGLCNTHEGDEKCMENFNRKTSKEGTNIDRAITFKLILYI
jgi:hypothetical protein